jgi:hypothetical protein
MSPVGHIGTVKNAANRRCGYSATTLRRGAF